MSKETPDTCPHCGEKLLLWRNPDMSSWGTGTQWVCFNDGCSYFQRGWKWMKENYNVTASYRYRFNPVNGASGPLPVWSATACRNNIVEEGSEFPFATVVDIASGGLESYVAPVGGVARFLRSTPELDGIVSWP